MRIKINIKNYFCFRLDTSHPALPHPSSCCGYQRARFENSRCRLRQLNTKIFSCVMPRADRLSAPATKRVTLRFEKRPRRNSRVLHLSFTRPLDGPARVCVKTNHTHFWQIIVYDLITPSRPTHTPSVAPLHHNRAPSASEFHTAQLGHATQQNALSIAAIFSVRLGACSHWPRSATHPRRMELAGVEPCPLRTNERPSLEMGGAWRIPVRAARRARPCGDRGHPAP